MSTSDFGISGTYPGIGRVIIAEVADEPLLGGALREQIIAAKGLPGTVDTRLRDDNPDNDAAVVPTTRCDAIVRFPQDASTVKGAPSVEQLEWIANGVRFNAVIQLGPNALIKSPTVDQTIAKLVDSFAVMR